MSLYYKNNNTLKRSRLRLNYLSSNVLRSAYLIQLNPIHHSSEKKIHARGSCVPKLYENFEVVIHRGKGYKSRYINKWMIGFKFGEFTWNRKIALYKSKQKKKKKKIKFEHILQIYWTKGFFFGGKLFYVNINFYELFYVTPGLGKAFKLGIANRLELRNTVDLNLTLVTNFKKKYKIEIIHFLNYYYSQVNSVNNTYLDLQQFNIVRLYLVKSYKGKCHSIGKPVNGQRTWSNAWSSYNNNYLLRKFIKEANTRLEKERVPEKINYKLTKKKYITKKKKIKKTEKKKNIWF